MVSVLANSALTSANVNAAFASKSAANTITGVQTLSNTTDSTSSTTGAVKLAGGMGVEKNLYVGALLNFQKISGYLATDSSTTGSNQTLSLPNNIVRVSHASLTSVCGVTAPTDSRFIIIVNAVGATITIVNDATATAANRIITGTGSDLSLSNNASILLLYDTTSSRWRIVGGSGGGGSTSWDVSSQQTLAASGTITINTSKVLQKMVIAGNGSAVELSSTPFGATPPDDGGVIHLIGASDTNTVSISSNNAADGCIGFSTLIFGVGSVAGFQYCATQDRYVLMFARNCEVV